LIRKPEWPGEQFKLLQIPCLLRAELEAIRLSQYTFICSQSDRSYLARFGVTDHLKVVPNSTRLPPLNDADHSEAMVLFVGSMIYPPNAVAADTLVRDIWPQILAHLPDARLVIAGTRPELIPAYSSAPRGVQFAGFVDDLGELYARARVVCCPIVYGGGTRVKIIEAAAYGRAIVATSLAAEGLDFRDGREILIRNDSAELAQECIRLLQKPKQAQQLGAAARALALSSYDREVVMSQLEQLFRGALSVPTPSRLS
jgi:glycosyltransferase involved in cell wall biosynthesis